MKHQPLGGSRRLGRGGRAMAYANYVNGRTLAEFYKGTFTALTAKPSTRQNTAADLIETVVTMPQCLITATDWLPIEGN